MRRRDLLFRVIDRYLFHLNFKSNSEDVMQTAKTMIDIDLFEMWMLTQK